MKSRVYLVFGIIGVILLAIFSIKPILLKTCVALFPINSPTSPVSPSPDQTSVEPSTPNPEPPGVIQPTVSTLPPQTTTKAATGALRVSNPTQHPVRIALLSRPEDTVKTLPVHWDFAPQEGSQTGLLLSLPEQTLDLQPGDILVGFAQDGSRRYWGPYVVGETDLPLWVAEGEEWQLILQP
jgi:hypothetical protein